jgi:hypothetical protein
MARFLTLHLPDGRSLLHSRPIWIAAVVLGAVLAFAPSLGNEWVLDDSLVILGHPAVIQGRLSDALLAPFWPPGTSLDKLYRPLTTASYRVEVASTADGRPDPARTHVANLVLHVATSVGVLLFASAAGLPGATAGLAATLFAVHPVHTEAVVTGYGRAELLAGLAGALLLWHSLRVPPERRSGKDAALATMLFLVAALSKEHGLLLWPAVLILDLGRWSQRPETERPSRGVWISQTLPRAHAGFAVVAIVFLLLRWTVLGGAFRLSDDVVRRWEDPLAGATALTRGLTALRLLWLTGRVLVDPRALCPVWSHPALAPTSSLSPDVVGGAVLAVAWGIAVVVGLRRRARWAALAGALLPLLWIVLHLPPAPHWLYAERWVYLPSVVIAVLVAMPFRRAGGLLSACLAVLAAVLLVPSTRAYARAFASNLAMARATVARQPSGFQGLRNLAIAEFNLGHWSEAIALARTLDSRFGSTAESEFLILSGSVRLGDRPAAEAALAALLRRYERYRKAVPPVLQDLARRVSALPQPGAHAEGAPALPPIRGEERARARP